MIKISSKFNVIPFATFLPVFHHCRVKDRMYSND